MTCPTGKGVRDYSHSAWEALDHIEAVRAEGRRYRPARQYDRPQLSERDAACQPHSVETQSAQPRGVVVAKRRPRPGRASTAGIAGEERQADLFK